MRQRVGAAACFLADRFSLVADVRHRLARGSAPLGAARQGQHIACIGVGIGCDGGCLTLIAQVEDLQGRIDSDLADLDVRANVHALRHVLLLDQFAGNGNVNGMLIDRVGLALPIDFDLVGASTRRAAGVVGTRGLITKLRQLKAAQRRGQAGEKGCCDQLIGVGGSACQH